MGIVGEAEDAGDAVPAIAIVRIEGFGVRHRERLQVREYGERRIDRRTFDNISAFRNFVVTGDSRACFFGW